MQARWQWARIVMAAAVVAALGACGGGSGGQDAGDTRADATTTTDATVAPDTGPATIACCPLGNCGFGQECVQGACLPEAKDTVERRGCYFDGECPSGATCEGETVCGCGIPVADCAGVPGACRYPTGCCNGDGDCGGGQVCVAGQCKAKAGEGSCWRDAQCDGGQVCEGAVACACGDASCQDRIGRCGIPGTCCGGDHECGEGQCLEGRCLPKARDLAAGACWGDGDCGAGQACLGESLCACTPGAASDASCALPSTPGRCGVAADACCASDADCEGGEICVEGKGCVRKPNRSATRDECWVDAHCGVGRVCERATLCGCDEAGCSEKIGRCHTPVVHCEGDAACPVGMRCARPDVGWCPDSPEVRPDGVCVPLEDAGECWSTDDCAGATRCGGEVVCIDGEGCRAKNLPGMCREKVKIRDCCSSHLDCEDDLECRNNDASLTCPVTQGAVCLPKPVYGESCWNLYDCPEGKTCQRTMVCGCNGKCRWNNMGQCETPLHCTADIQCGSDSVCAHDTECIVSPCTVATNCPIGGTCQLKIEGACWNHEECGAGEYCAGLRVCPADQVCVAPDQPGVCAPRGAIGECCTSLRGCKSGLRCLSPTQRSGCSADFASVCVPAVTIGNECFGDDDCDNGQRCEGALVCPCGVETCAGEPQAGHCVVAN